MLKLSSSKGIRIDVPVLSVSWSVEDHSVIIQALRKGLVEREASDTGGVPRWKSSCPDRLAEATAHSIQHARDNKDYSTGKECWGTILRKGKRSNQQEHLQISRHIPGTRLGSAV